MRRPRPVEELGAFEPWPQRVQRSWNPLPPIGRATRAGASGLVHENTLIMYVAMVAMAVSYQGLVAFAIKNHLPSPWVWPVPFDLAAFALARMAWKLHRLGHRAGTIRTAQHGLVALSVTLQVSMVEVPPIPAEPMTQGQTLAWFWSFVPLVIGHGAPALVADGLFEAALLLKRVGNKRAKPETKPIKVTGGQAQLTPEVGQRRPPSELETTGRADREGPTASPPGPDELTPEELALADQVNAILRDLDVAPTAATVRSAIVEVRGKASRDLVLKINRHLQARRETSATSLA